MEEKKKPKNKPLEAKLHQAALGEVDKAKIYKAEKD